MIAIDGQAILTTAQMRGAEIAAAPNAEAMYGLMKRAGAGVADVARRVAAGAPILVLCGPGNNGGDGYIAACELRSQGVQVRVAASGPPKTDLAMRAAAAWADEAGTLADAESAPIVVDALFGAGVLRRLGRDIMLPLGELLHDARFRIAVDVPSGEDADGMGAYFSPDLTCPAPDLTLAIGALKPLHVLPRAPLRCGEVRLIDIDLDLRRSPMRVMDKPAIPRPASDTHKYSRGMVVVVAGEMPGAAILTATAAQRAGAGYVMVLGEASGGPASLVHRPFDAATLADERIGAIVIGPGLGRSDQARERVAQVLATRRCRVVLDADALALYEPGMIGDRRSVVMTPHSGELHAMKKRLAIEDDPDIDRFSASPAISRALAPDGDPVLVDKGTTTVVTSRSEVRVATRGNPWLSTAGSGDVLAGTIAAMAAIYAKTGGSALDAAAAGVWLHAQAAQRLRGSFIADDLARALTAVRASL